MLHGKLKKCLWTDRRVSSGKLKEYRVSGSLLCAVWSLYEWHESWSKLKAVQGVCQTSRLWCQGELYQACPTEERFQSWPRTCWMDYISQRWLWIACSYILWLGIDKPVPTFSPCCHCNPPPGEAKGKQWNGTNKQWKKQTNKWRNKWISEWTVQANSSWSNCWVNQS